jgi:hypothetical protein
MSPQIEIRMSSEEDAAGVARLAQLDSACAPEGPLLLAEVGGELRAAVSLERGEAIADPFHRTSDLVHLLEFRRRQAVAGTR